MPKPTYDFPSVLRGKKILLCSESFGPVNGVSRTTLMLVDYLRSNGVHVAVVAPQCPPKHLKPLQENEIEIRLKGYPLPYNPDLLITYPVFLSNLYKRTFVPDLIYLASPASLGFQIMLQLRHLHPRVPCLANFQTDLSAYAKILHNPPLSTMSVALLSACQGYLFSHGLVTKVFYPSNGVRDYIASCGVDPSKLVQLRRGVDTSNFMPSLRNQTLRTQWAPNGELILLSVSRLAPEKGFGFLSSIALSLRKRNFPFHLVIVGGNKNDMVVENIHNMFYSKGLHDYVTFTGFKEGRELAEIYASADVFCHCSITETFGLVVLEAMASGVPVIARDEGGPSEIVQEGKTGYLVHSDDEAGFVARVQELGNKDKMEEMGCAALSYAEECTWERIGWKAACELAECLPDELGRSDSGVDVTDVDEEAPLLGLGRDAKRDFKVESKKLRLVKWATMKLHLAVDMCWILIVWTAFLLTCWVGESENWARGKVRGLRGLVFRRREVRG
jgi:glycosyltransferase involved in cell wall biosynthesis